MIVIAVRVILVKDRLSCHPLHLPIGHLAVQRISDDQVNIIHTVRPAHVEHDLEHGLAHVGRGHRRKRKRNIVHRNGHSHSWLKQRVKRLHFEWMIHRIPDRGLTIRQTLDRRIRIDDPRPDRNVLENKILSIRHDPRCGVFINVDN